MHVRGARCTGCAAGVHGRRAGARGAQLACAGARGARGRGFARGARSCARGRAAVHACARLDSRACGYGLDIFLRGCKLHGENDKEMRMNVDRAILMKKSQEALMSIECYLQPLQDILAKRGQGSRSVDDYTNEFYQLVPRNELQETKDQLVARYIGGLRVQLQDTVNLFNPVNVSSTHQRALIIEKQQKQAGSGVFSGGVAIAGTGGAVRAGGSSVVPGRPMRPANIGSSSSGAKCFKSGEPGHQQSECKKGEKKGYVY
ncbi:hypothetical protein CRG98_032625 [Punica granatum]|uniref:Retrotransposon gag domain-containing protein n=1 Tax=Punica granatum TaxID=22663 RepID=A0A2I0ITP4_PUNGR|nr:hypothetical protein CRG98_032625 [Punica granatum]